MEHFLVEGFWPHDVRIDSKFRLMPPHGGNCDGRAFWHHRINGALERSLGFPSETPSHDACRQVTGLDTVTLGTSPLPPHTCLQICGKRGLLFGVGCAPAFVRMIELNLSRDPTDSYHGLLIGRREENECPRKRSRKPNYQRISEEDWLGDRHHYDHRRIWWWAWNAGQRMYRSAEWFQQVVADPHPTSNRRSRTG